MTHDVFISYSSKDKPIADAICAHLEAAGIRCWIAPRDIAAGEDWPTSIAQAVSQSQALVLVFSAHSNSSEEVGRELFLAASHKLVILPFKIEDVEPEPGMQYYLARTHWLDAMNPPTLEQIQSLVDCIKTLVPIKAPAIPEMQTPVASSPAIATPSAGEPQASGKRRLSPWFWWILGLGIALVLVCVIGWVAFNLFSKTPLTAILPFQPASPTATLLPPTTTPTAAPTATPTDTPTIRPTITPTVSPMILPGATITVPVGAKPVNFSKVYISEPFNNDSLDWSISDIVGPWWLGTRSIANGVFNWDGTTEQGMVSCVNPGAADKQTYLSDEQVSARVYMVNQNMNGGYGLFIRSASDQSTFYSYMVALGQFSFDELQKDGTWKSVIDWTASPYITNSSWNTMMIQAVGSHFHLFFNNHLLAEADDASLPSGLNGVMITAFAANEKVQIRFDDFEVLLPYP